MPRAFNQGQFVQVDNARFEHFLNEVMGGMNEGRSLQPSECCVAANTASNANLLPAPDVPAIIDPKDPSGLVPTGTQLEDLEVLVPLWPVSALPGESDVLTLFWGVSDVPVATHTFPGPVDASLFPFSLTIPSNLLQSDGSYQIHYRVAGENGSPILSMPRTVTIDTHPPSYNQQLLALLLPAELNGGFIDEAYLDSHGNQVELRLPSPVYLDAEEGDVIELYWSPNNPPTSEMSSSKQLTQSEIDADDIRMLLPGDVIRDSDRDGIYYATYKVRDRAGNETQTFSREASTTVVLKPLPGGGFPEPDFPDATIWGYYNCENEPWKGVRVRINFINNLFEYQDRIVLFWQGYRSLNGIDPIAGTEGVFNATILATHVVDGYLDIIVEPFIPYIEPMVEGSGIATYVLLKGNGQSGRSEEGLVKFNRLLPGGDICGP
ncbi:hypothetical protein K5D68_06445 [Pseudomonas cichorii]|nr:hypothetical protein [Pseudomonas cichorii]MBX8489928.1 hypothetical protein [Pseudomonas cichorii]MBX8519260.1 hypothetical protein [Pseudomonas cichorii]MBX8549223.1 hypothetical protein [Pseudomonas cichorii]MBX8584203.1 hypothetical protein [Pseudomonas cichorii]